jgi:BrnA antitoxin of type II toxin-antitoxin system
LIDIALPEFCPLNAFHKTDVLYWLKSQGKGYQSRMNEILRKEMLASLKR